MNELEGSETAERCDERNRERIALAYRIRQLG